MMLLFRAAWGCTEQLKLVWIWSHRTGPGFLTNVNLLDRSGLKRTGRLDLGTYFTSSPGQSGGCSFSFSPGLKPQQNYGGDCFKTIYSYSLFGPGLCEGPLHVHTASQSHTSFSSDHSVQLNFSSSSSDPLDDGWCWGEDSSQLSLGEEGGDRQLMDRVRWEQGEL